MQLYKKLKTNVTYNPLKLSSSFLTELKNIYLVLHKTPFLWKDFPFNFSSLSRKSLKRTSFKKGLFCPLFLQYYH